MTNNEDNRDIDLEKIESAVVDEASEALNNIADPGERVTEEEIANEVWNEHFIDNLQGNPEDGSALDKISEAYDGSDRLKNAVLKSTGPRQEKLIKMGAKIWAEQKMAEREYAESAELYGDDEQDAYDPEDER